MTTPADDAAGMSFEAATTFADLVNSIDPSAWSGPGLGVWDLRGLVGHTSRALITVLTYLDQLADAEAIDSPERYYALAARQPTDAGAIEQRGRRAGEDLGTDPSETIRDLLTRGAQEGRPRRSRGADHHDRRRHAGAHLPANPHLRTRRA